MENGGNEKQKWTHWNFTFFGGGVKARLDGRRWRKVLLSPPLGCIVFHPYPTFAPRHFSSLFPSETPTLVLCACLGCGGRRRRGGKGGGWLSRHARRPETREAPSDDDAKEGFIKHGV